MGDDFDELESIADSTRAGAPISDHLSGKTRAVRRRNAFKFLESARKAKNSIAARQRHSLASRKAPITLAPIPGSKTP